MTATGVCPVHDLAGDCAACLEEADLALVLQAEVTVARERALAVLDRHLERAFLDEWARDLRRGYADLGVKL